MKTQTKDLNGNAIIASGSYRASKPTVQIDWTLAQGKQGPIFSLSSSGGRDALASHPDKQAARMGEICALYHLNDMNAATVEQKALGWGTKQLTLVSYGAPVLTAGTVYPSQAALSRELPGWVTTSGGLSTPVGESYYGRVYIGGHNGVGSLADYERVVNKVYDLFIAKPTQPDNKRVLWFAKTFGCVRREETKPSGHVYPTEHPEGVLGKACPVTGKGYGSAWYYHPIPEAIVEEIKGWAALDNAEGLSSYDHQARDFLAQYGIKCRITLSDTKPANWSPAGHHYRVTLSKKSARFVFDFWGSTKDAENKEDPSTYDVLACLASESNAPFSFADYCSEFGADSDSIEARQTFNRVAAFAKRIRAFFTDSELESLREIS